MASVLLAAGAIGCDVVTVASNDYTGVLAAACTCALLSLVAGLLAWPRARSVPRIVLVLIAFVDVAVIGDVVGRELATASRIRAAQAARLEEQRRSSGISLDRWGAGVDGKIVRAYGGPCRMRVVPLGELVLPTGWLAFCRPWSETTQAGGNTRVELHPGCFAVDATLADFSRAFDGSAEALAYVTVRVAAGDEAFVEVLTLRDSDHIGGIRRERGAIEFERGTLALVDDGVLASCLPPRERWESDVLDAASGPGWARRLADSANAVRGVVNVGLPLAQHGENALLIGSDTADDLELVRIVGGYDAESRLVALHVNLGVVH